MSKDFYLIKNGLVLNKSDYSLACYDDINKAARDEFMIMAEKYYNNNPKELQKVFEISILSNDDTLFYKNADLISEDFVSFAKHQLLRYNLFEHQIAPLLEYFFTVKFNIFNFDWVNHVKE